MAYDRTAMSTGDAPAPPVAFDPGRVRTALILVLIGGPIVVIDFTISRNGSRPLDILNDTVGLILLVWATSLLVTVAGPRSFVTRMRVVQILAVAMLAWSVVVQLAPELGSGIVGTLIGGVAIAGTFLFCIAMRDLSAFHGHVGSAADWRRAGLIVAILLGGGWLVGVIVQSVALSSGAGSGGQINVEGQGAFVLIFLIGAAVVLTPLVFILIAIASTFGELRSGSQAGPTIPAA